MKRLTYIFYSVLFSALFYGLLSPSIGTEAAATITGSTFLVAQLVQLPAGVLCDTAAVNARMIAKNVVKELEKKATFYQGAVRDKMPEQGIFLDKQHLTGLPLILDLESENDPLPVKAKDAATGTYRVYYKGTEPESISEELLVKVHPDLVKALADNHAEALHQHFAQYIANAWAPEGAGTFLFTTGTSEHAPTKPTATGTRKNITLADIERLSTEMTIDKVPDDGTRRLLLPPRMASAVRSMDPFIDRSKNPNSNTLATGAIGDIYGFQIFIENYFPVYDNNDSLPVLNPMGATGAVTDRAAALAFHPKLVRYAWGRVQSFIEKPKATVKSTVGNTDGWIGAAKVRNDIIGVKALIEGTAS